MIDKILDKISQLGIKSLSKKERELLEAHSKGEPTLEIFNELKYRQDRKDSLFSYDPRRDEEFFNELGFDFTEYDDDDLEEDSSGIDEVLEALKSDPDAMEAAADNDNEAMYKALERVANELGVDLGMDQIGELVTRAIDEI